MATDEERDGDRTKITLAAHGGLIKVEIAPGLDKGIVISADDGDVALGLLIGVEEQESVIEAIRRAQGRHAPTSTPLEERLLDLAAEEDRLATKADWPDSNKYERAAEAYRAALAMVREQGPTVPRAAPTMHDTIPPEAIKVEGAPTSAGDYPERKAALRLNAIRIRIVAELVDDEDSGGDGDWPWPEYVNKAERRALINDCSTWNGDPENAASRNELSRGFVKAYLLAALLKHARETVTR